MSHIDIDVLGWESVLSLLATCHLQAFCLGTLLVPTCAKLKTDGDDELCDSGFPEAHSVEVVAGMKYQKLPDTDTDDGPSELSDPQRKEKASGNWFTNWFRRNRSARVKNQKLADHESSVSKYFVDKNIIQSKRGKTPKPNEFLSATPSAKKSWASPRNKVQWGQVPLSPEQWGLNADLFTMLPEKLNVSGD